MKIINIFVVVSAIFTLQYLAPPKTFAQGTLFLSNLGEPSSGAIAAGNNSWLAQLFYTGSNFGQSRDNGFRLESVQILMGSPLGHPDGFSISIYNGANRNGGPGRYMGSLGGVAPTSDGVFSYSASNIMLGSLSVYWIVITSGTPIVEGSYLWNIAGNNNYNSNGGWVTAPYYDSSTDGLVWTKNGNTPLQFSINATAVPESSSLTLLFCGGLLLAAWRFRVRNRQQPVICRPG